MRGKGISLLLLIGLILLILKWKGFIDIGNIWIVSFFVVWFFLFYTSIHNKNKYRATPRPVYVVNK